MIKKIDDNTIVKVRMPKKLYESVKTKLKSLKETDLTKEEVAPELTEGTLPPEVQQAAEQIADFLKNNWGMIGAVAAMIFGAKKIAKNVNDKSAVDAVTGFDK